MKLGLVPAFPVNENGSHFGGLTKREWFAGMILQGIASKPMGYLGNPELASQAVELADELLAKLHETAE